MTNTKAGTAVPTVDDFLNESPSTPLNDPNIITSSDIAPPPPVKAPVFAKQKTGKYNSWRDRFTRPQGLDISDRMMPPITRRLTATYETLQENKQDARIIEGDKFILPPPIDLPPTYAFYDSGETDFSRANKMMKNVTRSEVRQIKQHDGQYKPQVEEVLEYVEFTNGHKMVDIKKNYILYAFLELHPLNESNKWRDKSKKPLFRRTDFDYKSSHVQMLQMDLQDEAIRYVKTLDRTGLINLASALTNPTIPTINVPISDIQYSLRLRARNNPEEVLFKSPDKKASKRIDVLHALEMGVLDYVPERNAYFLTENDDQPLFEVALDANPLEDIAKYLASQEGQDDYAAIMEYVNYYVG
jgi:hypothetical protein